ncbi:MAG TPA: hypothetical protein VH986_02060 [Acidimicrobiia bacterium]|jgi:hypothetical protein
MRRLIVLMFAALLGAASLAACSSSSGSGETLDTSAVLKATKAEGRVDTKGTLSALGKSGPIKGKYDYTNSKALLAFPVIFQNAVVHNEYHQSGTLGWVRRVTTVKTAPAGALVDLLTIKGGLGDWIAVSTTSRWTTPLVGIYDPVRVVGALNQAKSKLTKAGSTKVNGKDATEYHAKLPSNAATDVTGKTISLWIDSSQRVVRVDIHTVAGLHVQYDVTKGSGSLTVVAPTRAEIYHVITPGTVPTGPFATVQTTSAGSTPVTVQRAPSGQTAACWRVVSTPPFVSAITLTNGMRCLAAPTNDVPEDSVTFPVDAGPTNSYELIGALSPVGAQGVLTMTDGSTRTLTRDPVSGLLLYVGPPQPLAGYLAITLPGGVRLACGPGSITSPSDIADNTPALANQPWACLNSADLPSG